jgi:hypothetical protein
MTIRVELIFRFQCTTWFLLFCASRSDLEAIDALCYRVLENVANVHEQGVDRDTFRSVITNNFTTVSSDGREIG